MTLVSVDTIPSGASLLDVRWELGGPPGWPRYLAGHIPGAVFVELESALAGAPGDGGRHPLPAVDEFGAAMRTAGVSAERPVVVYDAGNSIAAARAWWLLRYFGHPRVLVLDGGFSAWEAAGRAIERDAVAVEPGDFVPRPGGMPVLDATGAGRLAQIGVLIDARAPERFRGEAEPIDPVAGHIPGAVNLPGPSLLDASGRFLDVGGLRERFAAAGVRSEGDAVGAYCGSGITAAHTVLALEAAGLAGALYPGSWSEWIRDPSRPVATGAA